MSQIKGLSHVLSFPGLFGSLGHASHHGKMDYAFTFWVVLLSPSILNNKHLPIPFSLCKPLKLSRKDRWGKLAVITVHRGRMLLWC